MLNYFCI